jgi:hypothetical protein
MTETISPMMSEAQETIESLPAEVKWEAWKRVFPWFVDNTVATEEGRPTVGFRDWLVLYGG